MARSDTDAPRTPASWHGLVVRADPHARTLAIEGAGAEPVLFALDAAS